MATQKTPARRSIASMLPKDALQSYGKPAETVPPAKKKGGKAYPANQGKTAKKAKR